MPFWHKPKTFIPLTKLADEKAHKAGLRHAIFTDKGGKYKGEWKNDRKDGKGLYLTPEGKLYEGDWQSGFRHGHGVLSQLQPNGTFKLIYRGDWNRGKVEGIGWWYYPNGDRYLGFWKGGKRNGFGRMIYANGTSYLGYWEDDKKKGLGLFLEKNNNRYEGMWDKDKRNGPGRHYCMDTGQLQEGFWVNNVCIQSQMVDIIRRQSCPNPTPFAIPKIYLASVGQVLDKWETWLTSYLEKVDSNLKKCLEVCEDPYCRCCHCDADYGYQLCDCKFGVEDVPPFLIMKDCNYKLEAVKGNIAR